MFVKTQVSNPASYSSPSAKLIRLHPSRYYLRGVSALHLCALFAILMSAINGWAKGVLFLFVLFSLLFVIRQWRQQGVLRVQFLHHRWCLLLDGSESSEPHYKIVTWHFWSVWLLIVEVEDAQGKCCRLPLIFDCCSPDEFRWLRVVIKYYL